MLTIKRVELHKPHGVTDRGSLEVENSNGSTDLVLLMDGMSLEQAGHLLIQYGHRLLKRHHDDVKKDGMERNEQSTTSGSSL